MRQIAAFVILCLLAAVGAFAQTVNVQPVEIEFRTGVNVPLGEYHQGKSYVTVGDLGLELRYNIEDSPWDVGAALELSCAQRKFGHLHSDGYDRLQNNRTAAIAVLGDYNFRQGYKVNPYAGLLLGMAKNDVVNTKEFYSHGTSMLIAPRVGVELFSHLRIGAQFNLSRRGYNNFAITIGVVFGGRPKK